MSTKSSLEISKDPTRSEFNIKKFKILLLGAGESGKSTVLKQVRLIHRGQMHPKDINQCADAIRKNALESMQSILRAMVVHKIPLANPNNSYARRRLYHLPEDAVFTPEIADDIAALWADRGVKYCYERRDLYWLLDGAAYYFDEVERLASSDYHPTDNDVIMARVRTTGIDSADFIDPPYHYSVVDVGGQRNERRKWVSCFQNVNAVVYLVGLSGYNQCLYEDSTVNRMQESLKLFKQVVSNPIFKHTPIFVFLNKKDLFEQMIKKSSLKTCFPEYQGRDGDFYHALLYIQNAFVKIMQETCPGKELYIQIISAREKRDMEVSWSGVKATLRSIYNDASAQTIKNSPENSSCPLPL